MSALSQLTKPAKPLKEPTIPGSSADIIRSPQDVIRGLGLGVDEQRKLEVELRDWAKSENVLAFRKGLMKALRALAPQDYGLRMELGRRAMAFWKATSSDRFDRRPGREGQLIIQKSAAAQIGEIRDWSGGKFKKVGEGQWEPVGGGEGTAQPEEGSHEHHKEQAILHHKAAMAHASAHASAKNVGEAEQHDEKVKTAQDAAQAAHDLAGDKGGDKGRGDSSGDIQDLLKQAMEAHGEDAIKAALAKAAKGAGADLDKLFQDKAAELAKDPAAKTDAKKVAEAATPELEAEGAKVLATHVEKAAPDSEKKTGFKTKLMAAAKIMIRPLVFGFVDNFVMFMAGSAIDSPMQRAGLGAGGTAGLGNAISDAVGEAAGGALERMLPDESKLREQIGSDTYDSMQKVLQPLGVFVGAIIGMVPLLFGVKFGKSRRLIIDLRKAEKKGQLDLFDGPNKPRGGGPFIGPKGGKWADAAHTIPWKEETAKPRGAVEPAPEELKLLMRLHQTDYFSVDTKRGRLEFRNLVSDGLAEYSKHEKHSYDIVRITDSGRRHIRQKRAKAIDEGKAAGTHKLAREFYLDRAELIDDLKRIELKGKRDEKAKPILAKMAALEKKHGAQPSTAAGVREAIPSIPADWRIPEREFGVKGKARAVFVNSDEQLRLQFTPDGPIAQRYVTVGYMGRGGWKAVGKKESAEKVVAGVLKAQEKLRKKWAEQEERRSAPNTGKAPKFPKQDEGPKTKALREKIGKSGKLSARMINALELAYSRDVIRERDKGVGGATAAGLKRRGLLERAFDRDGPTAGEAAWRITEAGRAQIASRSKPVKKSVTDADLDRLRPRLMLRETTNPLELIWMAEEVPDEMHTRHVRTPPGWPTVDGLAKGGGPFIGPRGGKWADAAHTIPWKGGGGKHTYGAIHRPISSTTVPKGQSAEGAHPEFKKFGTVTYDEPLSVEDQKHYSLIHIPSDAQKTAAAAKIVKESAMDDYPDAWIEEHDDDPKQFEIGVGQAIDALHIHADRDEMTKLVVDHLKKLARTDKSLIKGAGHKYIRRIPTGKPKPKYRYLYRNPKTKGLVEDEHLVSGSKFKVEHQGEHGHFEVREHHEAKGVVTVRHDESGRTVNMRTKDLHRLMQRQVGKKTREQLKDIDKKPAKPEPLKLRREAQQTEIPGSGKTEQKFPEPKKVEKPTAPLKRVSMSDLGKGGFDNIEGFSQDARELEAQARAMKGDREFAIIPQAGGFVLASKPKVAPVGGTTVGEATNVFMRGGAGGKGIQSAKAEYVLMEAKDIVASHDPESFGVRKDYPAGVQERRYHEIKEEQHKIDRIARSLEPAIVVNSNPDAINGSPVVSEDGTVLGGNGRTMGMQRAYAMYPESAAKMKAYMAQHAKAFGLSPAQVEGMKQPILVRRMSAGKEPTKLRALGRRMNEALTQGLDPRSAEVALGKNYVTADVLDSLTHNMEGDESLGDFLRSSRAKPFLGVIERAGIIDQFNRAEFVDQKTQQLNEDGRLRVERVLAARLIPDASLLSQMGQALRQNIAKAAPYLIRAESSGWDLRKPMMAAVQADVDMRLRNMSPSTRGRSAYLRQTEIGGAEGAISGVQKDPVAQALLTIVQDHNGARILPRGMKQFALEADRQAFDYGANISMFAREKVSKDQALATAFGLKAVEPEPRTMALAMSETARPSWGERLLKAGVGADGLVRYVMHAVNWELESLMSAAIAHAKPGKPIDGAKVLSKLQSFVVDQAHRDKDFARGMGVQPLDSKVLRGLVQAHAASRVSDIAKSLAKSSLASSLLKARSDHAGQC
jgi:hypothetical protein